MVTSALSASLPSAAASAGPGSDYFATMAHYLSLAGRVASALRDGRFVLVTGEPPPCSRLFCEALRKITQSRHRLIEVPCGPELSIREASLAECAIATLTSEGAAPEPQAAQPVAPLFLFEEVDRLSDQQIEQICEAVANGARKGAAGVLLARTSFLARLDEPPLQVLHGGLSGRLRIDEIGEDEGIEFLRHQLETRQRDNEARSFRPVLLRVLGAFGALAAVGIGSLATLHYIRINGELSIGRTDRAYPTSLAPPSATAPPATPTAVTPAPARDLEQASPAPLTGSVPPPRSPAEPPARPPQAETAVVTPAPAQNASPAPPAPAALSSAPPSRAGGALSSPDIAALVSRGDDFLSAGDITSARLFYERAADAGDGAAALRLGATYDPGFLGRAGVRGTPGDLAQAASWYRRARDLGETAAAERLKNMEAPGR